MKKEAQQLIHLLKEKDLNLALAESMTAGMAATFLAGCAGTSEVFNGGIVCYTPGFKNSVLHIPKRRMKRYSCESQEVTDALARNLFKLNSAKVCAAITGLASPGGSEAPGKPVGTVFLSVFYHKRLHRKRLLFRGSPLNIKRKACEALFKFIRSIIPE